MARKMKDSGIEWIGEIPEGWEVIPIKYLARYNYDTLTESCSPDFEFNYIDIGSVTYGKGITTFQKFKFKDSPSRARRVVTPGDILISTVRTYLRAIACVNKSSIPQIASTGFLVLQADSSKLPPQFLMYAVLADSFICNVEAHSVGISYPAINASQIVHFKIPLPPSTEQIPLINYLDNHCSKIDVLLSKIHSSIEEYKKLKQAVIAQAVTKGVRGEREMKDSGVEWIGEINHRFSLIKLKYICSILDQYRKPISADKRSQSGSVLYDYYGASGAIDKIDDYTIDDHVMLIGEDGANLRMRNLPLMYEVNGKAWINNHAHILKPTERVDFYYLFYALEELDINPYITGSAQPKLSQEKLQNIWVPLPDLEEQQEIATYIRSKCAEIDKLVVKKEQLVKELESYKKSLIYEVVTGKREIFTDITRKFPNI